jgi:DNA-binding LytR/AlgR family response regulator
MSASHITALVADDEPLLREALVRMLHQAWPALQVVAQARNGREAIELFEMHRPTICFLDVQMPGITGIEAAQHIGRQAHIVFVTAFDQYAVQAFSQGVVDYLVKPVEAARLNETITRLQERIHSAPAAITEELLMRLAAAMKPTTNPETLRWIRASVANTVRPIPIEDVDFLRAEEKYTVVGWRDETGKPLEAVIRTPLKDLIVQLDENQFAQIHRAAVVNLRAISHVTRNTNETADVHLKNRPDILPVSRNYLHLFRQM